MFEIIVYTLIAVLVIVGLCDLLHSLWMLFLKPKNREIGCYVTYLNGNTDYLVLSYLYEKLKWCGNDFADRVVVITNNDVDADIVSEFSDKGIIFVDKMSFNDDFLHLGVLNEKQGIKGNG